MKNILVVIADIVAVSVGFVAGAFIRSVPVIIGLAIWHWFVAQ
ncbi:hypothetical protein OH491_21830 [Termitidicoccus mucosus]